MRRLTVTVLCVLVSVGCAGKYVTPGAGVDLSAISDSTIRSAMEAEAAATFPARIAIARVQGPGYRSYSAASYGTGAFSLVTVRDVESDEDIDRLAGLPQVAAVTSLNKMVVSPSLQSTRDLRAGAASLKADMVFVYSLDTDFWIDRKNIGPFSAISLGFAPKNRAYVTTTASAALLDTRTGFVYGLAEGTAREDRSAHSWNKRAAVDEVRRRTESKAFEDLVVRLVELWPDIVAEHTAHDTARLDGAR